MVDGRETHWTIEISWSVEWGCSHGGGAMERCLGFGGMAKQFVSGGVVANRGEVGREAGGWGNPGGTRGMTEIGWRVGWPALEGTCLKSNNFD